MSLKPPDTPTTELDSTNNAGQEPINVKAGPFNAKGDGVTDDAAAFQEAIDAASASGQSVYIPAGTYIIGTSLLLDSNAYVYGDGWDSYLKEKAAAADSLKFHMFEPRSSATAITYGFVIRDLHLDGQASLQNGGAPTPAPENTHHGISLFNAENCHISHVWSENFDGDGIYLGRAPMTLGASPGTGARYNLVEACYVNRNVRNGMMIGCGSFNTLRENLFEANQVGMKHDDPKYAPDVYASAELDMEPNVAGAPDICSHNTVDNNVFKNGWWTGIQVTRPACVEDGNKITNNKFFNMRNDYLRGLGVGCLRTLVEGNTFESSGTTVTGTCTTTSGSPNLTNVSPTTGWQNGMIVSGSGIPDNTAILSGAGTSTMVMTTNSASVGHSPVNATITAGGVSISGTTNAPRFMRFTEGADTRIIRNTFVGKITARSNSHAIDFDDAGTTRPVRLTLVGNIFDFSGATGDSAIVQVTNCDSSTITGNRYFNGAVFAESGNTGTLNTYSDSGMWVTESAIESRFGGAYGRISGISGRTLISSAGSIKFAIDRDADQAGRSFAWGTDAEDFADPLMSLTDTGGLSLLTAGQGYTAKSADGTLYKLVAPNGGGAATWVAA